MEVVWIAVTLMVNTSHNSWKRLPLNSGNFSTTQVNSFSFISTSYLNEDR